MPKWVRPISILVIFCFLLTTPVYPPAQGFKKVSLAEDAYSLRAKAFSESARAIENPAGPTSSAETTMGGRQPTPALSGDSFPVMKPERVENLAAALMTLDTILTPQKATGKAQEILGSGVKPAKRGAGQKVAVAGITLAKRRDGAFKGSFDQPKPVVGTQSVPKNAKKASRVARRGLNALLAKQNYAIVRDCLDAVSRRQETIAVEYYDDHDRVMNLSPLTMLAPDERRGIYIDTDVPVELDTAQNRQGLDLLYAMGLLHQFYRISGVRQNTALLKVLEFYKRLRAGEKKAVVDILSQEGIDNANNFRTFLIEGSKPDVPDVTKQWYAVLLMKNELADLAYADQAIADHVLAKDGRPDLSQRTLTEYRETVHTEVSRTYSYEVERLNARRVSVETQERGMELVMGFLGRAGLVEQLLMAAAEAIPTAELKGPIGSIAKEFKASRLKLKTPELQGLAERWKDAGVAFGEMQRILNLVSKARVSGPQIMGAIDDFNFALNSFLMDARKHVQETARKYRRQIASEMNLSGKSKTYAQLQRDLAVISETVDGFISSVFINLEALEDRLGIPSSKRVVNVAFQRLTEQESSNLFLLNRLVDPYLGKTADFRRLLNEGGATLHATADMKAWLPEVTHWIQALPAYAWYKIMDLEGGNYRVMTGCERDILEYAFKGNIDGIAEGVEKVMHLEHAALARTYLAERMGIEGEISRVVEALKQQGEDADASREEAIRIILRQRGMEDTVAALATLVEQTYRNLEKEVTAYMAEHEYRGEQGRQGREIECIVALRHVIREDASVGNLMAQFLVPLTGAPPDKEGTETKAAAEAIIKQQNLGNVRELMKTFALQRRKDQPSFHNLTTLGPGETTTYLQGWLETGLTLRLLCRDQGLDKEVDKRVMEYTSRMACAAWHVIQELDLEADLFEYMLTRGLNPNEQRDRLRAAPDMINRYQEVSREVARICAIMEWEEGEGIRQKADLLDPDAKIGEPKTVEDYVNKHRQDLEDEANAWVISHYGLGQAVNAAARQYRATPQEIARNLMAGDEELSEDEGRKIRRPVIDEALREELWHERKAYMYHLARKAITKANDIESAAEVYNRLHSVPMNLYTARQEVVGEYIRDHEAELKARGYDNPFDILNEAKYRYEASGPYKKFNLGYTPSRVDLGEGERHSVEGIGKVATGIGQKALNKISATYELFNLPGGIRFARVAMAEFFKARENFFTRGGVFYLSLGEGVNIDALMMGDAEEYLYYSNLRGDRIVLPSGESYRGFCVPKEFFLIYAVMQASVDREAAKRILLNFAPAKPSERKKFINMINESFADDGRGGYKIVRGSFLGRLCESLDLKAKDINEWEAKAQDFFKGHYEKYFDVLASNAFLSRLPQLAQRLRTWGITTNEEEMRTRKLLYRLANWTNKKLQGLEQINRIGPYRKLELAGRLLDEAVARCNAPETKRDIKDLSELVYVTGGPYKAGTVVGGEDRPITDARLSSAAVKLLIFAGVDKLDEFDPEGKAVIREMSETFPHPAQYRIAGTVGARDILTAIPDIKPTEMDGMINDVKVWLAEFGINENDIKGCCQNLAIGADLRKWPKMRRPIKGDPALEKRRKAILNGRPGARDSEFLKKLHLLVTEARDVVKSYREAVQGADIVDLAVADPELLDLIDNMPEFVVRLRLANEKGLIIFADGHVGARWRAFSTRYPTVEFKVKELFALDETAVYGALALGKEDVDEWRREMEAEKAQAGKLFEALRSRDYTKARQIYDEIASDVIYYRKAEKAAGLAVRAERTNRGVKYTQCLARGLGNVMAGVPLEKLDFATWLILGGRYELNGRMDENGFAKARREFEEAIAAMPQSDVEVPDNALLFETEQEIDEAQRLFLKPTFRLPSADSVYAEKRTGEETAGKVFGERAVILAGRAARIQRKRLALMLNERRAAMAELIKSGGDPKSNAAGFDKAYDLAKVAVGDAEADAISQAQFSGLVYWTQVACLKALSAVIPDSSDAGRLKKRQDIEKKITDHLAGGAIDPAAHRALVKELARLIEFEHSRLLKSGQTPHTADKSAFETIAKAGELLDIILLVALEYDIDLAGEQNQEMVAVESLFNFFDKTLNAHIFDYFPFLIQPDLSDGVFDHWYTHDEKFACASQRHQWLYARARKIVTEKTALRHKDAEYNNRWLGDVRDSAQPQDWTMGLGVDVSGEARQFWFSYNNLRDTVAMMREFSNLNNPSTLDGVPELFWDVDPAILGADENGDYTNIFSVYNRGNTTMPTALEQGARLEEKGYNLMLCPFPVITYDAAYGREVLQAKSVIMYVSAQRYQRLLEASGVVDTRQAAKMASRVPEQGIIVGVRFKEPTRVPRSGGHFAYAGAVAGNSSFFHFTQELRPHMDWLRNQPLVQPIVKEGADYLKGEIPNILKGGPVGFPLGFVWRMEETKRAQEEATRTLRHQLRREPTESEVEEWVTEIIYSKLLELNRRYQVITEDIEKPEKESGGRGAEALPVLDRPSRAKGKMRFASSQTNVEEDLKIKDESQMPEGMKNAKKLAGIIYEVSLKDHVIVQGLVHSFARKLFTRAFLEEFRDAKAELGDVVSLDYEPRTPIFAYFRRIISRGAGEEFRTAMNIVVLSTEPIGNVARRSILKIMDDDAIVPEFRAPFKRVMDRAFSEGVGARHRYFRHAWPHILREYLVLNKRFGDEINTQLSAFLTERAADIVGGFFGENPTFASHHSAFDPFFQKWVVDFLGVDQGGREFSAALTETFGEDLAMAFKRFLGAYLEKEGLLNLEVHYSMDDIMPMDMGDDENNFRYILQRDEEGNLMLDDWGNVTMLPLADFEGRATDVRLYDKKGNEILTRDEHGNAVPVRIFDEKDGVLTEREIFDRDVSGMDETGRGRFRVSCIEACILEFNPAAGLWRPHDQELKKKGRGGEGVSVIFEDLGERGKQFKRIELKKDWQPVTDEELASARTPPASPTYLGAGAGLYMREPDAKPDSLESFIDMAAQKAREDLNADRNHKFTAEDMSLVFAYIVLEDMLSACDDDWDRVKAMFQGQGLSRLHSQPDAASRIYRRLETQMADGVDPASLLSEASYIRKLEKAVSECIAQKKDAISMRIAAQPMGGRETAEFLGGRPNCGLIFNGQENVFANTVQAFHLDAARELGEQGINFIGVHQNWLTVDNKAREALVVDKNGLVKKVEFETPVSLNGVGIFHLNLAAERASHAELSQRFASAGIHVFNPYEAAVVPDSKSMTHTICASNLFLKSKQPAHKLLDLKMYNTAESRVGLLRHFAHQLLDGRGILPGQKTPRPVRMTVNVVMQPDHGTEGILARGFTLTVDVNGPSSGDIAIIQDKEFSEAIEHLETVHQAGDEAIIREVRGNVTYKGRRIVLRLNACETPDGFAASTGLARVAASKGDIVVSKTTGATTEDINEVLWNIEFEGRTLRDRIDLDDLIIRMEKTATEAAAQLGAKGILGVDLLLEASKDDSGNIKVDVIFLEANPRPALLDMAKAINKINIERAEDEEMAAVKRPDSAPEAVARYFYRALHRAIAGVTAPSRQGPRIEAGSEAALAAI